jgi:hypothetical protein
LTGNQALISSAKARVPVVVPCIKRKARPADRTPHDTTPYVSAQTSPDDIIALNTLHSILELTLASLQSYLGASSNRHLLEVTPTSVLPENAGPCTPTKRSLCMTSRQRTISCTLRERRPLDMIMVLDRVMCAHLASLWSQSAQHMLGSNHHRICNLRSTI